MSRSVRSAKEILRHYTESYLPRTGYGLLSTLINWSRTVRSVGLKQSRQLWKAKKRLRSKSEASPIAIQAPNLSFPIYLRPGTTDIAEFFYSVVRETYAVYLPKRGVEFCIDAGANLGDTAAWFASRIRQARVIAVEPDPDNFELLRKNSSPYGNRILPIRAAVWPEETQLSLSFGSAKDAVHVNQDVDGTCPGMPIPALMKKFDFPRIDVLKCDIEGAEKSLFSVNSDEWLAITRFIVIETHGQDCLDAVLKATSRHGFIHREYRNLHVFDHDGTSR